MNKLGPVLQDLAQQQQDREHELRLIQGLEDFCTSVRHALQNPSFEVKQKVLQLVVDRIIVDEQHLTIQHVVPTGPVKLQMGSHVHLRRYHYPDHTPAGPYRGRFLQGFFCKYLNYKSFLKIQENPADTPMGHLQVKQNQLLTRSALPF
jgi:hypothetical protein